MKHYRLLALLGAALLLLGLIVYQQPETTLERAVRREVIRVGYAPEEPFSYRTLDGHVTGESVEVLRLMLARMGIERVEWVQTEWSELIPELRAGRFDLIATGMFITCERARLIAFTEPIFGLEQSFLVRTGNPHQLHSYAALAQQPVARLAVVTGAHEQRLAEASGLAPIQILEVPDARTGLMAVIEGHADAFALTRVAITALVAQAEAGQVEVATPFEQPQLPTLVARGYGAYGLRHADVSLRTALNEQLQQFVGTPEHQRLVAPFGFTAADLPGSMTTEALLTMCEPL
ncbi:ectoine/hydroxyectoine ABC transporter substrate-binding protein EhuB [Candidatus Viridilinea mediisalina]|uniref:Ectoine/hydroxyectoine ABC transporter substrate-binding protein EhuB n=1 Tax=Candidatus Viridilinea mediisalina TaxID=2024553 RepID=A0A2A6RE57_9CHLR|nr:ectoine/hydroxyectoine ABC transporter substrate-binding protein EhuB [Candidatus Viridilinea mediisalina]PDW00529.1 ectoine/hydroxyectoine ABC transporter substrate-binding protein EhuB [Candidatus Viridilinea mediisalina]